MRLPFRNFYFSLLVFIPFAAMCRTQALAQPSAVLNPTLCAELTKGAAALSTQLQQLQAARNSSEYAGAGGLTLYDSKNKDLQNQLAAEEIAKNAACKPATIPFTSQDGYAQPKYMILTVIYAPPGGKGGGQVEYGSESEMSSKVTTTNSDKVDFKASATLSGGAFGDDVSATFGYGTSGTDETQTAVTITKSEKYDLKVPGPAADGIDHGEDTIYLLLNPQINLRHDSSSQPGVVWEQDYWGLGIVGTKPSTTFVYAKWLLPGAMPANVATLLASAGITPADYAQILSADPFAAGSNPLQDGTRYVPTVWQFNYVEVTDTANPGQAGTLTLTNELQNATTKTTTAEQDMEVDVDIKISGGFVSADVKLSQGWTFVYKKADETSTKTTQSAALSVGQPSSAYNGPVQIGVYYDTIFQTYVFVGIDATGAVITGTITDSGSKVVAHQVVTATMGGNSYRTYTDSKGHYTFVATGPRPQRAQVSVNNVVKSVNIGSAASKVDFVVSPFAPLRPATVIHR